MSSAPRPHRPARGGSGRRPEAPNRPPQPSRARAPRPDLPEGVAPSVTGDVRRELRQHVRGKDLLDEVLVAVTLATDAIEGGDPTAAVPYLEWAKEVAPRAPVLRETLAIAHYLAEDYAQALGEVRAYRRLSARADQDHLLADCLRATGRPPAEVGEVVRELLASDAPADRRVEGLLVWAGAVADGGDVGAARAVLRHADRSLLEDAGEDARGRHAWLEADLAARAGDRAAAIRGFERLTELEGDPYDAAERLEELR